MKQIRLGAREVARRQIEMVEKSLGITEDCTKVNALEDTSPEDTSKAVSREGSQTGEEPQGRGNQDVPSRDSKRHRLLYCRSDRLRMGEVR